MIFKNLLSDEFKLPESLMQKEVYLTLEKMRLNGSGYKLIFSCRETDKELFRIELPEHYMESLFREYFEACFAHLDLKLATSNTFKNLVKSLTQLKKMGYTYKDEGEVVAGVPTAAPRPVRRPERLRRAERPRFEFRAPGLIPQPIDLLELTGATPIGTPVRFNNDTYRLVGPYRIQRLEYHRDFGQAYRTYVVNIANDTATLTPYRPEPNGDAPAVQQGWVVEQLVPTTTEGPGFFTMAELERAPMRVIGTTDWADWGLAPATGAPAPQDQHLPGHGIGNPQRGPELPTGEDVDRGLAGRTEGLPDLP